MKMKYVSIEDFVAAFERAHTWALEPNPMIHVMNLITVEEGEEVQYQTPDLVLMSADDVKQFEIALQRIINEKDGRLT